MKLTPNINKISIDHIHLPDPFIWEKRENGTWVNNFGKLYMNVEDMQAMLNDAANVGYAITDISVP